jgi:hypothetical protein
MKARIWLMMPVPPISGRAKKGKWLVNPKDREQYVGGQANGRKASTPWHFHGKYRYHDEAFAFAASAVLFAPQRVVG